MQNAQKNACNLKKFQYNKGENPNRTSTDIFWKEGELMYKKRFLRLVSAVLALCMMAALLPTAAFAADPEPKPTPASSFTFSYDKDTKTASVTGFTGSETEIIIPGTVKYDGETYTVTSIGDSAFHNCSALTSVTIPSGVTSIGNDAFFECSALTSVTIPSSVTSIEWRAFSNCDKLTSVTFDENSQLTSIGEDAFVYCSALTSVTIPSGVTSIGEVAFAYCSGLTSIEIPSGVTSIKRSTFYECSALESVTIPSSVTSIGKEAFYKCSALTNVTFADADNSKLTSIGEHAFGSCESLSDITIPASVTSIGNGAFSKCSKLSRVTFEDKENSKLTGIPDNMLNECGALKSIELPAGITSIGIQAFRLTGLTSIVIPDGVTTISDRAFMYCDALQTVTIPASVTSVASNIFSESQTPKTIYFKGTEEQWKKLNFTPTGIGSSGLAIVYLHTVKFDPNGHGTAPENIYVENKKTIPTNKKPTDPTETGYTFKGWYYTENETEKEFAFGESGTPVTSSMTLKAKWEINRYTVTFMNGEDEVKSITADYNSTIAINDAPVAPGKEGSVFGGWYNGTEKFVFDETKVTRDLTLTAKWTKGSYTLTVDGSAESHVYDEEVTVDEPTKEGYTFAGWTVEPKNVTPQKGDDGKWSFKMPAGNVTLTAKWKINRYTVKFMNGEDEVKSIPADYNSTIAVNDAPVAPVKEGFVFGGWYSGSEKFVFGETKVTSDLTLTAKWTKGSYTLTVDGSAEGHDYDEEVAVDEPTKEGYTFAGWTVETKNATPKKGGDGKWSFKMPAGNVTLTAEWKINEYTVIFVTAHDNTPNSLTVKHGETILGDRVLKADGYEFGGWYNGKKKFVFGENGTKVTANLTLTARWTEVKKPEPKPEPKPDPEPVVYEIVVDNGTAYLDDGATAIHTAEEGQTVILKVNPEALTEGVAFDQWEIVSGDVKLADATASETRFEMPASAVELKATVKAVESPAAPAAINPASVMAGTVVLGVGAVSVGWSAYHIATELYLKWVLPQGIIPTTRGQLALLLWNQADQPAVESTALYTDIDASDEQAAARWVIENKKMELVNSDEADVFEPDLPVDIFAVAKAWRKK